MCWIQGWKNLLRAFIKKVFNIECIKAEDTVN